MKDDCKCNGKCVTCKCKGDISAENRLDSYAAIKKVAETHRMKILKTLKEYGEGLTATELGVLIANDARRQFLAPRLTELKNAGKVKVVGKRLNHMTGRQTSIYEVI